MKKQTKVGLFSFSLAGMILLSGALAFNFNANVSQNETVDSHDEITITEGGYIKINEVKQQVNDKGQEQLIVYYSIIDSEEEDIQYLEYNTALTWNSNSSDPESATWRDGKDVYDYMEFTNNTETNKVIFTCLNPFGNQMLFTISPSDMPSFCATIKIDYKRRITTQATASFTSTALTDGKNFGLSYTLPVFSIGSKGDRLDESKMYAKIEFESSLKSDTNTLDNIFNSYFPTTAPSKQYQHTKFKYQEKDYTDYATMMSDIEDNVETYVKSLASLTNTTNFSFDTFKSYFTYYGYVDSGLKSGSGYFTYTDALRTFVKNYNDNISTTHFTISCGYNETDANSQTVTLGFNYAATSIDEDAGFTLYPEEGEICF